MFKKILIFLLPIALCAEAKVKLGVDCFFREEYKQEYKSKNIGLITNHTGVDQNLTPTVDLFLKHKFKLKALFAPEHGITGKVTAGATVKNASYQGKIPIYSLHGETRRPTKQMLRGIDVLFYDIQDIGIRSYTFASTLFYCMEEAAKAGIEVVVLDRPNPLSGQYFEGPMLEKRFRSFVGYINVPYCHGMTIGELATFFNTEYKVGCKLKVIPMKGWKRSMTFADTGLSWIPTSLNVPEANTPFYAATTGVLGELGLVNTGMGFTLPFKVVAAEWLDAEKFCSALNAQKLPGVYFRPVYYRPTWGSMKGKDLSGAQIHITDLNVYRPQVVQCYLLGILKTLYPERVLHKLSGASSYQKEYFCKVCGNETTFNYLMSDKFVTWKLLEYQKQSAARFNRAPYTLYK